MKSGLVSTVIAAIPSAIGAVVMGTGIVSIGLMLDHRQTFSRVLLVIAALAWIGLGAQFAAGLARRPAASDPEAPFPTVLSVVAATAVLGSRVVMLGWSWAGVILLATASAFWVALLGPVLIRLVTPTVGGSLMLTVATESLAVLCAALGASENTAWLVYASLLPFVLGLGFYVLVISRFDLGQLISGQGDHWITGGALAISTLAISRITLAAHALHRIGGLAPALRTGCLVLWVLTIAWLPVLLGAEVLRPRLEYDIQRWSTVFPVGMYAAASFYVGAAARVPTITDFARVWVWAGGRHLAGCLRGHRTSRA